MDKTCHVRVRNTSITTGLPWNNVSCSNLVSGFIPGQGPVPGFMNHGLNSKLSSVHSLYRLTSMRELDTEICKLNLTIILGNPGTGKSTAADYFKQGAKKRNLRVVAVQASEMDINVRYGVLSKIFLRLLDPLNRCEGDVSCQIALVDSLLKKLPMTFGHEAHPSRKFLLRILQLECSSAGARNRGYSNGEMFTTVLDRRMSVTKINKTTRGVCNTKDRNLRVIFTLI